MTNKATNNNKFRTHWERVFFRTLDLQDTAEITTGMLETQRKMLAREWNLRLIPIFDLPPLGLAPLWP
jgi:hypothetical protein